MVLTARSWVVWGIAVLAYATAILQRTSLAVAAEQATRRFEIGASAFSLFVVLQLLTYASMQIPVGIMLDRIGSRIMIAAGGVVMAAGQITLSMAEHAGLAILARILVGLGDAMTFISVLRVIPAWFPARQVPLVTQLTGQFGQLGQVVSTIPLVAVLAGPGWTPAYLGAGAIGVLMAVLVLLVVRDRPRNAPPLPPPVPWGQTWRDLQASFREPGTRLGLWTHLTTQFSGMVFALLWGFPFMTAGLGYDPGTAGALLSVMVLSATVVGPVLGTLTGRYPLRRSNLTFTVLIATITIWTVVLLWPGAVPLPVLVLLVMILSAYGPASAIGFDYARTFNPVTRLGAATGIVNMGGFVASLITIFVIGVVLDLRTGGTGGYTLADFKIAFCFQYVLWTFGLIAVWHSRRLARAELRAGGTTIDSLPHAVQRQWRSRRPRS